MVSVLFSTISYNQQGVCLLHEKHSVLFYLIHQMENIYFKILILYALTKILKYNEIFVCYKQNCASYSEKVISHSLITPYKK